MGLSYKSFCNNDIFAKFVRITTFGVFAHFGKLRLVSRIMAVSFVLNLFVSDKPGAERILKTRTALSFFGKRMRSFPVAEDFVNHRRGEKYLAKRFFDRQRIREFHNRRAAE